MSKKLIAAIERQGIPTSTTIPKRPALVNDIFDTATDLGADIQARTALLQDHRDDILSALLVLELIDEEEGPGTPRLAHLIGLGKMALGSKLELLDGLISNRSRAEPSKATPIATEPAPPKQAPSQLCDLWSLGMTTFATNVLRSNGISSISQLTSMTKLDLIKLPRAGKKTVPHIQDRLAANGLSLATGGAA